MSDTERMPEVEPQPDSAAAGASVPPSRRAQRATEPGAASVAEVRGPAEPPVAEVTGPAEPPVPDVPPGASEPTLPGVPPVPDPPASVADTRTDVPSEDVATAETATLPGEHRGGFHREFTEPVPITASTHLEPEVVWAPAPERLPRSAPWALTFALLGLIVSFLVGWGFLIGLVGAGLAIVALRRPWESRQAAVWALCLSVLSLLYSAGWLWWASTQGPLLG